MELSKSGLEALDYLRNNGERYRRDFCEDGGYGRFRLIRYIQAIKQLRSDFKLPDGSYLSLLDAKNAIEAWHERGLPFLTAQESILNERRAEAEAKILLKNLLLREARFEGFLTTLERDAIKLLIG